MKKRAILTLVALSTACSYDLEVLKGRRVDGGVDAAVDVPVVDVAVDRAVADVVTDAPRDSGVDAPTTRDASMGTCTAAMFETLTASPGGVTVVNGTTVGGTNALTPSCQSSVAVNGTRVYRYEVQTGPRLVITTNTGLCGAHDTVLAAYFSCDTGSARPVGSMNCNDDDMVNLCVGCSGGSVSTGCGIENATLDLSGLVPRDVVYITVSSYSGATAGPFRMAIAENGLTPQPPPAAMMGAMPANRCNCPDAGGAPMTGDLSFPRSGDNNQLATPMRQIFGARTLPFSRITGVSARLALSRYNVDTSGACAVSNGAQAAIDLLLNTTVVATGRLNVGSGAGGFVTIPLTNFAPVTFASTSNIPITYRLRNIEPSDVPCVTLDVDLNAPNSITLYGTN